MVTDDELNEYAAMLAERFNNMDLPEIAPEHSLGTERRHAWVREPVVVDEDLGVESQVNRDRERAKQRNSLMTGVLVCYQCGYPIREHPHCWCTLPRRKGWVPPPPPDMNHRSHKGGRPPKGKMHLRKG